MHCFQKCSFIAFFLVYINESNQKVLTSSAGNLSCFHDIKLLWVPTPVVVIKKCMIMIIFILLRWRKLQTKGHCLFSDVVNDFKIKFKFLLQSKVIYSHKMGSGVALYKNFLSSHNNTKVCYTSSQVFSLFHGIST